MCDMPPYLITAVAQTIYIPPHNSKEIKIYKFQFIIKLNFV